MAVSSHFYAGFFRSLCNKEVDIDSDVFKMLLVDGTYTPDQTNHRYKSSVSGEVTGTGYTAGGFTLATGLTISYNATTKLFAFDAVDAIWPAATITPYKGIVYDNTPATDATRPLVGWVDFGSLTGITSIAGDFTATWDSSGIGGFTLT